MSRTLTTVGFTNKLANEGGKGPFFSGYREKDYGNCSYT